MTHTADPRRRIQRRARRLPWAEKNQRGRRTQPRRESPELLPIARLPRHQYGPLRGLPAPWAWTQLL